MNPEQNPPEATQNKPSDTTPASEALSRDDAQDTPTTSRPALDLMYFGYAKVSIRGPVTGNLYEFSRLNTVRSVDARDAISMLKTRLFRRLR